MLNQREQKAPKLFFAMLAVVLPIVVSLCRADVEPLQQSFRQPPDDARIMVRWWWFGPAVTKPGLEREMKTDEGRGDRRVRGPAHVSAGGGRGASGAEESEGSVAGIPRSDPVHRREGEGIGPAHGSDPRQRVALRRAAVSRRRGGGPAPDAGRAGGGGAKERAGAGAARGPVADRGVRGQGQLRTRRHRRPRSRPRLRRRQD